MICSVFLLAQIVSAADVSLAWDPVLQPIVSGYRLYYGTLSGRYHTVVNVGNATTCKVSDLAPGTYFFAVTAYSSAGEESAFSNEVKHTIDPDPAEEIPPNSAFAQVFPRFSFGSDFLGEDAMTGLVFLNQDSQTETLTFTALEGDGTLVAGPGIANPASRDLNPWSQLPIIDWQIFGSGIIDSVADGWGKLENAFSGTCGLYVLFNSDMTLMDSVGFSKSGFRDFIFTEIQEDGRNKISIINSHPEEAKVDIELMRANGTVRSLQPLLIAGNGAFTADLFSDLFTGLEPDAGEYVHVSSASGLSAFQAMRRDKADIAMLVGQDSAGGGTTLYSPLYIHDDFNRTSLSIVNLDDRSGMLRLRLKGGDGSQIGTTAILTIPAKGKLHIEDPGIFLSPGTPAELSGYIEIESDGLRLAGSSIMSGRDPLLFAFAFELTSRLQTSALVSFVLSDDIFYSGLVLINPNPVPVLVTINIYAADGDLLGRKSEWIGAGEKDARLFRQYFPSLSFAGRDRASGYVRLTSDLPIVSFAAFGTNDSSSTSTIPAQDIQ